MLRNAALDITQVVGCSKVTRSPGRRHGACRQKGACNTQCSLEAAWGWPGRQLVSLTPQQLVFHGIAVTHGRVSCAGTASSAKAAGCLASSTRDSRACARPGLTTSLSHRESLQGLLDHLVVFLLRSL